MNRAMFTFSKVTGVSFSVASTWSMANVLPGLKLSYLVIRIRSGILPGCKLSSVAYLSDKYQGKVNLCDRGNKFLRFDKGDGL